ncbi:MAG TPA: TonB-dependent receptor [Thermoanaerobaculia bacterium]|nr:TonB-dependent receptor [Thermoanaerobaculia bacterium]
MRTSISGFFALLFFCSVASAATLVGTARDGHGRPIAGVTVAIGEVRTVTTNAAGRFSAAVPEGTYRVRFSHPGFRVETRQLKAGDSIDIVLLSALAETITVSGIRAEDEIPVTKTDIGRQEIERLYHGQEVPLLLRDAPSITAYSESGVGGAGYSYIQLRGIAPTRINFTLDGVPLADSEDMGTYFADFPDLARSLESVQIQRGVGTSTVGTPSFGGSVNMESIALDQRQKVDATVAGGSFGNQQVSVGYHSGSLPGGLALYSRLSYLENDGFRENSAMRQRNLFFSGSKDLGAGQLKLTGFAGHEDQQSSYYAADEATLRTNLRANPLRPEEKDSFGYDLAQLQYIRPAGDGAMTASAYYQRGYGWFRLFRSGTDTLREYRLDGMLLGTMLTYSRSSGPLTANYGVHVNRFKRDHSRDNLTEGVRDYANYGVKGEANAFAKASYTLGRWLLFGDAQVRQATFDYYGSIDIPGIRWTFFNPKIGARYRLSSSSSVYGSAGMSSREPARNDMFFGEDNPSVAHDLRAVRPERVVNVEAGWSHRGPRLDLAANVYAMEFHDEIAATGELSDIGLALRRNVDRSYRRGLEVEVAWQPSAILRLKTSGNLSRNRIRGWTQFFDVYDARGEWIGTRPVTYGNVAPLLTPSLILSQSVEYTPSAAWRAAITGRYVGESYLDNTNDLKTPAFFAADATLSVGLTRSLRLTLQGNNIFDNDEIFSSGYSYLFMNRDGSGMDTVSGIPYYFPQATRNFVVLLDLRL